MASAAAASPQPQGPDEDDLAGGRMPFLSHLGELRDRVRNAAIAFVLAVFVCYYFSKDIFAWLQAPLFEVWKAKGIPYEPRLVFTSLTEPFWVNMSISLWAGIFVASPVIFYQLWKFIAPGLYKRERRIGLAFAGFSAIMFVAGAMFFRYVVIKTIASYMLGFSDAKTAPMLAMGQYLDLIKDLMLAFGAVFELPLLIYFLAMIGMVTHRSLWKFNRWFVVIAFVVGAIPRPTPDGPTQPTMAIPMVLLYNLSIVLAWTVTRKRERDNPPPTTDGR